jgi:hypothetical protein
MILVIPTPKTDIVGDWSLSVGCWHGFIILHISLLKPQAMPNKHISRSNIGNQTPDQADYRGHVLFDRTAGNSKTKSVRRMRPEEQHSPFHGQSAQQKVIR